jgi:hypothetical protein
MTDIKWVVDVDANQKQLKNARVHNVSGDPGAPAVGQLWYDTVTGKLKYRDGVGTANIDLRNRATHTGSQAAATISDLATVVKAYRLDEFGAPTVSLNLNSQKTTNQADPTTAQDGATKNYVDVALATALAGTSYKDPVRVATTVNGTLATAYENGDTVDGVVLATGNRILLKNQTAASENGIYLVNASGAPTRASDANSAAELQGGAIVAVDEGTANNNTAWMLATDVVTLGTDSVSWVPFGAGTVYTGSLGVQLVGTDFRANPGTGLTLSGNQIVPDYAQIMRRKIATGYVGTSGTDITIAHNFGLTNKADIIVQVYEDSTGAKVEVGLTCVDTNNVTLSFETTPTSNQYRYSMQGLT